ncbi:MAG: HupE/UreJ family protein [Vicinamibacterales bacterium]
MQRLIPLCRFLGCVRTAGVRSRPASWLACLCAFIMVLSWTSTPFAHDIPTDIVVQVLVKPEGNRLRALVRLPLVAIQDIEFPQRGPGYLEIPQADETLRRAAMQWVATDIDIYENDERLQGQQLVAVRASLPSDRSFAEYDQALAHVLGPRLADTTEIVWQQVVLDMLFEYPIKSDQSAFSLNATLARLGIRTQTVLRFVLPDGTVRAFDYRGNPGLVSLDPGWSQAVFRFVGLGFEHILDGIDHLLFLACLVIPIRRFRALVAIVTSFTIAHSVTLISSAFNVAPGAAWFPPLIETLIAASIVYMASENVLGVTPKRRWLVTFLFGLVHGFGFSFALRETLQFAGGHLLTSLLAFNLGVELGQLLVIVVLVGVLSFLFNRGVPERAGTILLSGYVAHTAWHWTIDRGMQLSLFNAQLGLPVFDQRLLAPAIRWGMLALIIATLIWLMSMVFPQMERDVTAETPRRSSGS